MAARNTHTDAAVPASTPRWTDRLGEYIFRRRRDLIEHELDGEAILYDPVSGSTCRLNLSALRVWRKCDGIRTVAQIAEQQAGEFDVDAGTARDHVGQLLVRFVESGLLVPDCTQSEGREMAFSSTS